MQIFDFRDNLIRDCQSYIKSFIQIRDPKIREYVEQSLEAGVLFARSRGALGKEGAASCFAGMRSAARVRAELDAYYARHYGLTRDELRYMLDPKEVYGPDFPSETFHVLKEKEIKKYGKYRARRLVLEAWYRI